MIAGISIYGLYNDYMLEELRRHPRLRGTVNILPNTDRYVLERMKQDGVVGVRLQLTRRKELRIWATMTISCCCDDSPIWICTSRSSSKDGCWPAVLPRLEASGVKIVIDHFGHPDPEEGVNCPGFKVILQSVERGAPG